MHLFDPGTIHSYFTALIGEPGPTPCFTFWQEVMACYVLNTTGDDNRGAEKCIKPLDDYYECLYHRKEVSLVST